MLHPSEAIHALLSIRFIQDGILNGSQQILQTRGSGTIPVGMSGGFVTYQMPRLYKHVYLNK